MSKDSEREDLLQDLEKLRDGKDGPDTSIPALVILLCLLVIGSGWLSSDKSTSTGFVSSECKVSGCNNELCVGADEFVSSTCEFREDYACYVEANTRCEVQATGKCGWSETDELSQCLAEV